MLAVTKLTVRYGSVIGVRDLDLTVADGEVVALLGPNGAGKTSTLNAIVGLGGAVSGTISLDGEDLNDLSVEDRVRKGVSLSPEGRRVFPTLTVGEHLRLGASTRRAYPRTLEERLLDLFPILKTRYDAPAGNLSGGEQQQVAIARALMSEPRLLLLDEPSLGLAPRFVELVFSVLGRLSDDGMTILLVEQAATRALELADRAYVLVSGSLVEQGSGSELLETSQLEAAYLGADVSL